MTETNVHIYGICLYEHYMCLRLVCFQQQLKHVIFIRCTEARMHEFTLGSHEL